MLSILKLVLFERNKKGASTVLEGLSTQEMKELSVFSLFNLVPKEDFCNFL